MLQQTCSLLPEEECPVCQVKRGDIHTTQSWCFLPCKHHLHTNCLSACLMDRKLRCPGCRKEFQHNEIVLCRDFDYWNDTSLREIDAAVAVLRKYNYYLHAKEFIHPLYDIIHRQLGRLLDKENLRLRSEIIFEYLHHNQWMYWRDHKRNSSNSWLSKISREISSIQEQGERGKLEGGGPGPKSRPKPKPRLKKTTPTKPKPKPKPFKKEPPKQRNR